MCVYIYVHIYAIIFLLWIMGGALQYIFLLIRLIVWLS